MANMANYFFHISGDQGLDLDEFGIDLPDLEAVCDEAAMTIAGFARDAAMTGGTLPGRAFEICDDEGTHLLTIPFLSGGSKRFSQPAMRSE